MNMVCAHCEGTCICSAMSNPPCSFCENHNLCEICQKPMCRDMLEKHTDNSDGSIIEVCPDCERKAE